jgi:hypothetical protein
MRTHAHAITALRDDRVTRHVSQSDRTLTRVRGCVCGGATLIGDEGPAALDDREHLTTQMPL